MNEQQARQMLDLLGEIRDLLKPRPSTKMNAKVVPETDDEWINRLSTDIAYSGIDVKREYAKARAWADTNKKQVTRRFFINWLNRVERPIATLSQAMRPVLGPPVMQKKTEPLPQGVPPPPEVAEKLSRLLGGDFMKSMGGTR